MLDLKSQLSLSCRIAEGFLSKEEAIMSFSELADVAVAAGYKSICMRGSQIGVHTETEKVKEAKATLNAHGLNVTMITGDFDTVYNNDRGPSALRNIGPTLDLAETLEASLVRVCMKSPEDIPFARAAADLAEDRGIRLVTQCHIQSIFETVDQIVDSLEKISHPNFGLIYEAANLEQCRQPYGLATIERLVPWIANVYIQNQRLNPNGKLTLDTWSHGPVSFDLIEIPDNGGIDFKSVLRGLNRIGYTGPITVHQSAPEDDSISPESAAKSTAEFLNGIF